MINYLRSKLLSILYILKIPYVHSIIICDYIYDEITTILSTGKYVIMDDKIIEIDKLINNLQSIINMYNPLINRLINNYPRIILCEYEFKTCARLIILKYLLIPEYFENLFEKVKFVSHCPIKKSPYIDLKHTLLIQYIVAINQERVSKYNYDKFRYKNMGDGLIELYGSYVNEKLIKDMFRGYCKKNRRANRKKKKYGIGWMELRDECIDGPDINFVNTFLKFVSNYDNKTLQIFKIILMHIYGSKWKYVSSTFYL
jgi:hypothetical protein